MKTSTALLLAVALAAGLTMVVTFSLRKPDSHLTVSEQPIHKLPASPGAQESKP